MSNRPTCAQCGAPIDYRTVSGLCKEHYDATGSRSIKIPDDFAAFAENKGWREICSHYGISRSTLTIWRRETAIANGKRVAWSDDEIAFLRTSYRTIPTSEIAAHLGRTEQSVKTRAKKLGLQEPVAVFRQNYFFLRDRKPNVSGRVQSTADTAAAFIRAYDRTPVYRCNPDGTANPKGNHWKYGHGRMVLTEDELFAKAERKGWSRDEWKRLAA